VQICCNKNKKYEARMFYFVRIKQQLIHYFIKIHPVQNTNGGRCAVRAKDQRH
jgi:hypothetical protein